MAAALSDPDAQPLTDAQLVRMRRIAFAKHVRFKVGLSQDAFAECFGIPLGTLRDWEQHRTEPDTAAQSYLKVILKDPGVAESTIRDWRGHHRWLCLLTHETTRRAFMAMGFQAVQIEQTQCVANGDPLCRATIRYLKA